MRSIDQKVLTHWKNNLEAAKKGEELQLGAHSCAYCRAYFNNRCEKCPVYIVTGRPNCIATPYLRIYGSINEKDELIPLIEEEISLLEEVIQKYHEIHGSSA